MAKSCFLVLLLIFFAFGCGESVEEKAMEKKIEEATGGEAEVDLSEQNMKITAKTEEGQFSLTTGESVEIPEDFPTDVLIYSPSEAVMAMNIPQGHSLSLKTSEDITEVTNAYKAEMKAKGWSEKASMNMGGQSVLMYKKEDRVANITIAQGDGANHISVTVITE